MVRHGGLLSGDNVHLVDVPSILSSELLPLLLLPPLEDILRSVVFGGAEELPLCPPISSEQGVGGRDELRCPYADRQVPVVGVRRDDLQRGTACSTGAGRAGYGAAAQDGP